MEEEIDFCTDKNRSTVNAYDFEGRHLRALALVGMGKRDHTIQDDHIPQFQRCDY